MTLTSVVLDFSRVLQCSFHLAAKKIICICFQTHPIIFLFYVVQKKTGSFIIFPHNNRIHFIVDQVAQQKL